MKKLLSIMLTIILAVGLLVGCGKEEAKAPIRLATTTSTQDSGLLDYLLPRFEEKTGYKVEVISKGTGQALKLGENGDVDVVLVHAKDSEEKFVKEGHGAERIEVMYNDFIVVGPKNDPAKIKDAKDAKDALKAIYDSKNTFVSRGDDSGTDKFEKKLWKKLNIKPSGDNYISAGKGMLEVLMMANEKNAYTISDRATYLANKDKLGSLDITYQKSDDLKNQYGIIAVNDSKNDSINKDGAQALIDFVTSEEGQKLIGEFGKDKYGEALFTPNAKK
ncbi:MAG: substrate-binding domain-containing protein [Clostridium sp.]|uniref:extracellular solute-binding protein n=1 Tax=Clostridium sp. TaxID=1506 RepID=UPI002FC9664F